jgi:hypothetical protein
MLVSAYDIHFSNLRKPERFYKGKELVFIDSGGYELSPGWDSTEPNQGPYKGKRFTEQHYRDVLDDLPKKLPFVIANYDWGTKGKPLTEQILAAQELFGHYPRFMHNFLMKPHTKGRQYLDPDEIARHAGKLARFNIVGVTEKELGKGILERLVNLTKVRAALDRKGVRSPLHVWGGLDPVLTPMYFFAGAEIFDGLSWLRYAYHAGVAVYRDSCAVLDPDIGIETRQDHARALVVGRNLSFLGQLASALQGFVDQGGDNFAVFGTQAEAFERAYHVLRAKAPDLK